MKVPLLLVASGIFLAACSASVATTGSNAVPGLPATVQLKAATNAAAAVSENNQQAIHAAIVEAHKVGPAAPSKSHSLAASLSTQPRMTVPASDNLPMVGDRCSATGRFGGKPPKLMCPPA